MIWKTALLCACLAPMGVGQAHAQAAQAIQPAPKPAKRRVPYFIDPTVLAGSLLLPPPPAAQASDLAEVHRIEAARTPQAVAAAQWDDAHEDIFVFAPIVGPAFSAEAMPATAALSAHLRNDSGVVNAPLKERFQRPRPYHADPTLHAVCKLGAPTDFSYPSGHAMVGYLMALTLTRMVPEQAAAILARADTYAQDRVVCGVHYPSDIAASRAVAYALFGFLLATPRFEQELAAATKETRTRLGLNEIAVN